MNYEEALAYYPAVVSRGDVAAFVAPVAEACRDEPDEVEGILWAAWGEVVARADEGLVPLVAGVKNHPAPDDWRVWGLRVFADLPVFGASMREVWDQPGPTWPALNAFAARLTPGVMDFLLQGLWTIRTALETPADPALHVPAAVAWFRHAGPQLVDATTHNRTYAGRLGDASGNGFSVPRWIGWRRRLEALADQGDHAARDGLKLMKRYDRAIVSGGTR
ncbi:DUF3632 domain-containing protein [Actinoplanes sp. CA-131856]